MSGDERGEAGGRPFRTDGGQGPETLTDLKGIGSSRAEKLRDAGFETVADLRAASQAELAEV
ncbi:50S ribosomal protein L32e, partial [Halobacteriales archaeon QH_1_68_42]